MRQITIGCELEGGLTDWSGSPVDTLAVLGGGKKSDDEFEALTSDLGISSLEAITAVCDSGEAIGKSLARSLALVPDGYRPRFITKPFGDRVEVAPKPRYAAVAAALLREHPRGDQCIHTVAPWASTQFHIWVGDVHSPEAVLLLNFLNNIAPYARLQVIRRYGVVGTAGHLRCWQGWSKPERVPGPHWFADAEGLDRFVAGIPKVVTERDGIWVPADGPSRLGDRESEGTIWWAARPRQIYQTVEWRPFPSLPPHQAADLGGDVLSLAVAFFEYVAAHPHAEWRSKEQCDRLYRHLVTHDLVPPQPQADIDWWRLHNM